MNSEFCDLYLTNTYYLIRKQNVAFFGKIVDCDPFEYTVDIEIDDADEPIVDYNGNEIGIGGIGTFKPTEWKFQKISRNVFMKRSTRITPRSARGGKKKRRTRRNKKSKL